MRAIAGERAVVIGRAAERVGDLLVHEAAARLGHLPVRGAAHEIVREVVAAGGAGAQDAVALELLDGGDEIGRRQRGGAGEQIDVERAAERGGEGQKIARAAAEAVEAIGEQLVERVAAADGVGPGRGQLEREQRIAARVGEDARGVVARRRARRWRRRRAGRGRCGEVGHHARARARPGARRDDRRARPGARRRR